MTTLQSDSGSASAGAGQDATAGVNARNRATINRLYAAFAQLDGARMQACYAPQATFRDAVFTLDGQQQIGGMWRMLTTATRNNPASHAHWQLRTRNVTDHSAHWKAEYLFSATGRPVVNRIDASFTFDDHGRILSHQDRFNFWAWSRQALGATGLLLGWTPFLRRKVRAQAAASLKRFLASQ